MASRLGGGDAGARCPGPCRRGGLVGGLVVTGWDGETTDIHLLEQALAALPEGDSSLRAQVLARLAAALYPGPTRPDRQAALREQAVGMARRLGDPQALLVALHAHWATLARPARRAWPTPRRCSTSR